MEYSLSFDNNENVVHFLQVTDMHLFGQKDGELLGVNTANSFSAILAAISKTNFPYRFVLATGDLVQDQSIEGYHRFAQMVKPVAQEIFWITGNHDFLPKMDEAFAQYAYIKPNKHILVGKYWQCLLLDSQVFGSPHGMLSEYQLDWLLAKLTRYPERYTVIVLHHNILPTYSAWLDQHSLRNVQLLEEVISHFSNVKAILHGHIHQSVDQQWGKYRVLSTPSTCIQFKPCSNQFTLDLLAPGWREISLYPNGTIETQVKRLASNDFLPNLTLTGY